MCKHNNIVSKCIKQNLALLKGEIDKPIIMIGYFKTLL